DPLLRMTMDWHQNEREMIAFAASKATGIARAMKATHVNAFSELGHYDTTRYQSTHVQGGTILGKTAEESVVNPYGQHWDAENLFVLGGSLFPQSGAANPTPTLLALTWRTADAMVERYLKSGGRLE